MSLMKNIMFLFVFLFFGAGVFVGPVLGGDSENKSEDKDKGKDKENDNGNDGNKDKSKEEEKDGKGTDGDKESGADTDLNKKELTAVSLVPKKIKLPEKVEFESDIKPEFDDKGKLLSAMVTYEKNEYMLKLNRKLKDLVQDLKVVRADIKARPTTEKVKNDKGEEEEKDFLKVYKIVPIITGTIDVEKKVTERNDKKKTRILSITIKVGDETEYLLEKGAIFKELSGKDKSTVTIRCKKVYRKKSAGKKYVYYIEPESYK